MILFFCDFLNLQSKRSKDKSISFISLLAGLLLGDLLLWGGLLHNLLWGGFLGDLLGNLLLWGDFLWSSFLDGFLSNFGYIMK